ncbi:hypothetical protein LOTGIDRAFT_232460 [Lottia gigantea]|uniref:Cadherin domain-containing protein n=1 Tax=Lottia gigantea TaxID=225164 RepID=V4ABK8_LOTGI|nr:hypothetical protein LOTGIDRAFT_232460 [Lottia gigantea]ESO94202.1 hypothetical protein LOTGIDRAFT_232460 [Lottia gigantea]
MANSISQSNNAMNIGINIIIVSAYIVYEVTNVTLGDECSFDNDIYKICIDPDTVCSKTEGKCKCDRNHAEIDGQCVELPDKLFSNKYEYQAILANQEPNKVLNFSLNVPQEYLRDTKLELIPQGRKIEVNGINENNEVQVIVSDTKLLQSEVMMLKVETIYGGVKVHDSMLFKLEIVINETFDSISIEEEKPNGTRIDDFSLPGFKDFEFVDCPEFTFKQNTIYTNKILDRERGNSEYHCKIKATFEKDNQCTFRDVGSVIISIEDINDNPPVFPRQTYFGKVKENDPEAVVLFQDTSGKSVKITTADRDITPNNNITYTLSGGDDLPFSLTNNDRDAVIKVKRNSKIDKETKDNYIFIIEASDGINKNSATVTIEIIDVNEPAKFTKKNYTFNVSEDDSNVFVGYVIAVDEDKNEKYRKNKYNILSGSFGYFEITQNGSLYLKNTTRQKQTLFFELIVSVSDENLPEERETTNVTIRVTDVNESPKFNQSLYNFIILEGDACKDGMGQVYAYEIDFKDTANSIFKFSIESNLFNVDPETGNITCKNSLDYEQKTEYELEVKAVDKGSPPLSSTTKVLVKLEDANDNDPILDVGTNPVILCSNIRIKGKPITVVRASDADSGLNGQLTFSITKINGEDIFGIDDSGLVFVKEENNTLECNKNYTVEITCSDNGVNPRSVRRNLKVSVSAQGIKGLFKETEFVFNITEGVEYTNFLGIDFNQDVVSPTAQLFIVDRDAALHFSLRNKTLIINGIFDRENKSEYRIILKATETSGVNKSDIAVIRIHIIDVNDNPPVITDKNYIRYLSLYEGMKIGKPLIRVEASDADETKNTLFTYSLLTPNIPFIINSATGNIITSEILDREKTSIYHLLVSVTDGNFTDVAYITVEIKDVNDNPPVIQDPGFKTINVTENLVHQAIPIKIRDEDSIGSININLNRNCPLSLNNPLSSNVQQSGSIATGELNFKSLDYEEQTKYECIITATDGNYTTNKTLVINVVDVNDNSPVFRMIPGEIRVDVPVNPGDILVDMINATDADSGSNGQIMFSVEPEEYYEINKNTGEIRFKSLQNDSTLVITITATDSGIPPKSSVAKINVTISNDRPKPEFIGLRDDLEVTENNVYQNLYTVKANISNITLANGERQCEFQYSIKGNSNFEIDEKGGNISLVKALDREELVSLDRLDRLGRLGLVVVAKTECGNFPVSSSTTLFITIMDENDNKPECKQQLQRIEILQSLSINDKVGQIEAKDDDDEYNGIQTYAATSTLEYFFINPKTGLISLKKKFPTLRKAKDYLISALVADPNNNLVCNISITVNPDNFNAPVFSQSKYTTSLDIGAKKGEVLVVDDLKASDKDNDTITYNLDPEERLFRINSSTNGPIITLTSDIKVDTQTVIILKVYAVDDVSPIKTGTCTIEIAIEGQFCLQESSYRGVKADAETATLFQILFYGMLSALSLCVVLLVILCYKWRTLSREKTKKFTLYKTMNRRPQVYDEVGHAEDNRGFDAVSVDGSNYYYTIDAHNDKLSTRSAVMFNEPPPDYPN